MDWKDAVPVVQDLTGIKNLSGAIRFYEDHKDLIKSLWSFFQGLRNHRQQPAVVPPPPPVILVAPPLPVVTAPQLGQDVASLHGILRFVEKARRNSSSGQRGELEDRARFLEIQAGAFIDDGSWLHTDCTPRMDDGTELAPGDPRWSLVNNWAPNGQAIWLYYEFDGLSTLDGHHSEGVEPSSVEDDHGCTPAYKVTAQGPHKIRFGFQYKRHDGKLLDTGVIGQGDVVGGVPFNVT